MAELWCVLTSTMQRSTIALCDPGNNPGVELPLQFWARVATLTPNLTASPLNQAQSDRIASSGSARAARKAGIRVASRAIVTSNTVVTAHVPRSSGLTP